MTHAGQEFAFDFAGGNRAFRQFPRTAVGFGQVTVGNFEIASSLGNLEFEILVEGFQAGATLRRVAHRAEALTNRDQQEYILEHHPTGMFQPAPRTGGEHAEYRLRPEKSPSQMINSDDHRGGQQHAPIPVESQECQ